MSENRGSPKARKVSKLTKKFFNIFKKLLSKTRKRVLDSNERVVKRTAEYFKKRNKCSAYKINQKVLVKYESERKRLKDGIIAMEKLKKSVNMIRAKLVIETQLTIRKFLVGSL